MEGEAEVEFHLLSVSVTEDHQPSVLVLFLIFVQRLPATDHHSTCGIPHVHIMIDLVDQYVPGELFKEFLEAIPVIVPVTV